MTDKVLFLDRDGTINIVGPDQYVHKPEYFYFTDGIFDVCREAQDKNYKIIIITNQTGISKHDYTEKDMQEVHRFMRKGFEKEGIYIEDIFYTKHEYSPNRKPNPGMFLLAKQKYELSDFDMFMSVAIGDRQKDAEAALGAGVGSVIYYQTSKALDENWNIVSRTPTDLTKEIKTLKDRFNSLMIFGALAQSEHLEQEPVFLVRQEPKLFMINNYKELEGRL